MTPYRQALEDAARVCREKREATSCSDFPCPREYDLYLSGIADAQAAILALPEPDTRALAKHQPCGCVICSCENDVQCGGCGAKHCGQHPVGQFVNPVFAEPAQPEPVAIARTWHKNGIQHAELYEWTSGVESMPDGEHNLYAAPPAQSEPRGWTDEEIMDQWAKSAAQSETWRGQVLRFARSLLGGGK